MKERPILFSAPMVNAILNGTKTVTRRTVKLPNGCVFGNDYAGQIIDTKHQNMPGHDIEFPIDELHCSYGQVGDQLWVREAWRWNDGTECGCSEFCHHSGAGYEYRATGAGDEDTKWKPSIHMPRKASRIQLEITGVRVERLQDISEEDAKAEGGPDILGFEHDTVKHGWQSYSEWYLWLWESINGAGSWAANPWVWVIEFRRVE